MNTHAAEAVADAVLYEGYVLYPYRASASKNRMRWQVGLVVPRDFAEATRSDPWFMQAECLADVGTGARLTVRVRCLHVQERRVEEPVGGDAAAWRPIESLIVGGQYFISWDEAVKREFVRDDLPLEPHCRERCWSWDLDEAIHMERIHDETCGRTARLVRCRRPVRAAVRVSTEPVRSLVKIRLRIENVTPCPWRMLEERDSAVRQSLAGAHAILGIENGTFISALEPPAEWADAAAACRNVGLFPVLAGPPDARDAVLVSPIILYDHPAIAPESHSDLCDGTEIDELLTLRVKTLTEDEKREARATDERAARIVDQCDTAPPEAIARLHGAIRSFEAFLNPADEPPPEVASVEIGGRTIGRGARVRLHPARISDSLDLCLRGRPATVTGVYRTLEDRPYVAVALDHDPLASEGAKYRRSLFFHPEELVPIGEGE